MHVADKDLWALGVPCLFFLKPGAKFIPHVAATQPGMNVTTLLHLCHFARKVTQFEPRERLQPAAPVLPGRTEPCSLPALTPFPPDFWSKGTMVMRLDSLW